MKPAAFDYHAPVRLEAALDLLARLGDEARVIAGGQSLVPIMNMRISRPAHLIDLNGIADLTFIREAASGVEVGALTRHAEIGRSELLGRLCPLLPAAARSIGHYAIRERGTIGGSLALADPAAQWPLVALLLGAEIEAASSRGRRRIPAAAFFQGIYSTALESDEILSAAIFPRLGPDEGWGHCAFSRRHGDFALVAVAVTLMLDAGGAVGQFRLALGGIGGTPLVLDDLAAAQRGKRADVAWAAQTGVAAAAAVQPDDTPQASADLRRDLVRGLVPRALAQALARARKVRS